MNICRRIVVAHDCVIPAKHEANVTVHMADDGIWDTHPSERLGHRTARFRAWGDGHMHIVSRFTKSACSSHLE